MLLLVQRVGKGIPAQETINIIRRREERRGESVLGPEQTRLELEKRSQWLLVRDRVLCPPELAWGTLNVTRSDDVATLDLCPVKKSAKPNFMYFLSALRRTSLGSNKCPPFR
jgi:hypothetical protein